MPKFIFELAPASSGEGACASYKRAETCDGLENTPIEAMAPAACRPSAFKRTCTDDPDSSAPSSSSGYLACTALLELHADSSTFSASSTCSTSVIAGRKRSFGGIGGTGCPEGWAERKVRLAGRGWVSQV